MYISIAEAQGQLLDLVRRAEAGEEVLLTHEGRTVGKLGAVADREGLDRDDADERLDVIDEIVGNGAAEAGRHGRTLRIARIFSTTTTACRRDRRRHVRRSSRSCYEEPAAAGLRGGARRRPAEPVDFAGTLAEALRRSGAKRVSRPTARHDSSERLQSRSCPSTPRRPRGRPRLRALGKGLHAAALNFGDSSPTRWPRSATAPLLFIGDDFALTDVTAALP